MDISPGKFLYMQCDLILYHILWRQDLRYQYNQYTASTNYRIQRADTAIDACFENRPERVKLQLIINQQKAATFDASYVKIDKRFKQQHEYKVLSTSVNYPKWEYARIVNVKDGTCTCHLIRINKIPCVHMFLVFEHTEWKFIDLPVSVRNHPDLVLDLNHDNNNSNTNNTIANVSNDNNQNINISTVIDDDIDDNGENDFSGYMCNDQASFTDDNDDESDIPDQIPVPQTRDRKIRLIRIGLSTKLKAVMTQVETIDKDTLEKMDDNGNINELQQALHQLSIPTHKPVVQTANNTKISIFKLHVLSYLDLKCNYNNSRQTTVVSHYTPIHIAMLD